MHDRDKEFWEWYYSEYLKEIEKAREKWEGEISRALKMKQIKSELLGKEEDFVLPSPEKVNSIDNAIKEMATPKLCQTVKNLCQTSVPLLTLSSLNPAMYEAAFVVWKNYSLFLCSKLVSSGVSAAIAKYATEDLGDFSFAKNGKKIGEGLGIERLISNWNVPSDEYIRYWSIVDKRVKKVFKKGTLEKHFAIYPIVDICSFEPDSYAIGRGFWDKVGKFCSYVALALGAAAGGPLGVAGVIAGAAYLAGDDDDD